MDNSELINLAICDIQKRATKTFGLLSPKTGKVVTEFVALCKSGSQPDVNSSKMIIVRKYNLK